jgi:hypothetical protein
MAWDGSHLWAPISSSVIAEVTPSNSSFNCWSSAIDLSTGYQSSGPLYAAKGIAFANGSIWASGVSHDLTHHYLLRINPFANGGPAITGEWQIAQLPDQILFDGTSLWVRSAGGSFGALFRVDPVSSGTPTITPISGFDGANCLTAAFDGTHLWISYSIHAPHALAAYVVNSSTTTLPAPVITSDAVTGLFSMSTDSAHLWGLSGGSLNELNLSDGSALHLGLSVGSAPTMVATDGTYTWVSGGLTTPGTITGVLANDPSSATSISLLLPPPTGGLGANGVYFDGTNVWAAEANDGTIERLLAYPTMPLAVATTTASDGSATLTWSPPASSGNAAVTSYEFGASPSAGITISAPRGHSVTFHGLQPGVTYTVKVRASNGPYTGDWATTSVTIASTTTSNASGLANTGSHEGKGLAVGALFISIGVTLIARRRHARA